MSQPKGQLSIFAMVNIGLPLILHFALQAVEQGQTRLIMALAGAALLATLNLIFYLKTRRAFRVAFATAGVANLLALISLNNVSVISTILMVTQL